MQCITNVKRKRDKVTRNEDAWNQALTDAENQLQVSVARAERLREIIADLKKMRDSGEPWPGENAGTYKKIQVRSRMNGAI